MVTVIKSSSVDLGQNEVQATFATREEACVFIAENTVDGVNVSADPDCDYLRIDGDDD